MNEELTQEENKLLDSLATLSFEEAHPLVKTMFQSERILQTVKDERLVAWCRKHHKRIAQIYKENEPRIKAEREKKEREDFFTRQEEYKRMIGKM